MLNDRGMIIYTDFIQNSVHSWNITKSLPPQKSVYIPWQSLDLNLLNMKVVSFPPNLLFPNKANPVKPHLLWDVYIVIDICTRRKYYKKHGRSGQNVCSLKKLVISANSRSCAEEALPRLTRGCESLEEPCVSARRLRGAFCSQILPSECSVVVC